ncbi:MAG: cytochrome c [Acidobacteriota bacterium]|nr:cytochrome c [Acidobacteriota bacterium]
MQKTATSGGSLRGAVKASRSAFCLLLSAFCLLFFTACRRDMQDQPKMKPYRSSTFFTDGQSSRQLVEGTVPRGFLKLDSEFFTGKKRGKATSSATPAETQSGPQPSRTGSVAGATPQGAAAYPNDVELFPIPVTKEMVNRGKERYEIFCSACHGLTGNGDGMIVRRGFRRAASFNDDRLRQAPVGHFFDAITNGWGAMPSYAPQIPAQDRWAIIAYIRALQLSQQSQQAQTPSAQAPAQASAARSPATQAGGPHP